MMVITIYLERLLMFKLDIYISAPVMKFCY